MGLDYEISIRCVGKLGWRVGLYDPKFHHAIGNSKQSVVHIQVHRRKFEMLLKVRIIC